MQTYSYDSTAASTGGAIAFLLFAVFYLALIVFGFYLYWRLVSKTGWPGWYSLAMLVPVANLVFMIMFVFKEWPVEAENRMLRQQVMYGSGGFGGAPSGVSRFDYPSTQPGFGAPQGYPAQPGYGAQPGYPTQPGYPAPDQGGQWGGPPA